MTKYDIAELIKNTKRIYLPRLVERLSSQRKYRKILRELLRDTGSEVAKTLLPIYAAHLADDREVETAILMYAVIATLERATIKANRSMLALVDDEAKYLNQTFINVVKRATKADVSAYASMSDLDALIKQTAERNASLIKSISDETRDKITRTVINAQIKKLPPKTLKAHIKLILKKQGNRADLIATDQLEKMSAQILKFRANQAGMHKYIWQSKMDGRERARHHELHGTEQDDRDPNHGDDGQSPREPIRCRCEARYFFEAQKERFNIAA